MKKNKKDNECWIGKDFMNRKWDQCCCRCKWHIPLYYHCSSYPKMRDKKGTCICNIQKGWICMPPGFEGRAFDNWPEHSIGCEMFDKRD